MNDLSAKSTVYNNGFNTPACGWAWAVPLLRGESLKTLAILDHLADEDGSVTITKPVVGFWAGIKDHHNVGRALADLVTKGVLQKIGQAVICDAEGGRQTSLEYKIVTKTLARVDIGHDGKPVPIWQTVDLAPLRAEEEVVEDLVEQGDNVTLEPAHPAPVADPFAGNAAIVDGYRPTAFILEQAEQLGFTGNALEEALADWRNTWKGKQEALRSPAGAFLGYVKRRAKMLRRQRYAA